MATIASLNVLVKAKTGPFAKKMKGAAGVVRRFAADVARAGKTLIRFGVIAAAAATAAAAAMLRFVIRAASEAEEIGSKFQAVFKQEAKAAQEFAESFGKSVGRATTDLKSFLATIQDTFVPLGFARKEARVMSQAVVKLAVDLASFNNAADADAILALQSALVGNHETMRRYGVIISQATIDQELLRQGFKGGALAATEQQKAFARLEIILRGTTDAQGDALRTAGSFANQMKALRSAVRGLAETIGEALLPFATELVKQLTLWVNGMNDAATASQGLGPVVANAVEQMTRSLWGLAQTIETVSRGWHHLRVNAAGMAAGLVAPLAGLEALLEAHREWAEVLSDEELGDPLRFEYRSQYQALIEEAQKSWELLQKGRRLGEFPLDQFFKDIEAAAAKNKAALDALLGGGAGGVPAGVGGDVVSPATTKAVQKLTDAMQLQIDTFGWSNRVIQIHKLRLAGATEAQLKQVLALDAQLRGLEIVAEATKKATQETEKLEDEIKSLYESTRTPLERYAKAIGRLDELRKEGLLTEELYGRAVRKSREELEASGRGRPGFEFFELARVDRASIEGLSRFGGDQAGSSEERQAKAAETTVELLTESNRHLRNIDEGGLQ